MCLLYLPLFMFAAGTAMILVNAQAPTVKLSDGYKIPLLGLGTYGFKEDSAKLRQAVLWAIDVGYRYIDTEVIPKNEEQIGLGIADAINNRTVKREDLFITTRLWRNQYARDQVVPALKKSLERLGLKYTDLYLLHSPRTVKHDSSEAYSDYVETWQGMEETKRLGLTRSIGVSNFNIQQIEHIISNNRIAPVVNQLEVHPSNTQKQLVRDCQNRGIAVVAYSPFGFLPFKSNKKAPSPRADDPILIEIAEKYGKTTFQVVERNIISIPKTNNKERLRQNINIFDFKLSDDEIAIISRFNSNSSVEDSYWNN